MSVLEGCRVLLVEDESLVAMLAEDMLLDLGCEVVVAMRLDKALAHARTAMFDLAVLDVNLGATSSYPVADLLSTRGIPFLFATGYGTAGLEADYRGVPVMQKPYQRGQMAELLCHLLTCTTISEKPAAAGALRCLCLTGLKPVGPAQFRAD